MKYRDPSTGELKDISVKVADTLPVGTIVEFDGKEVPDGYAQYYEDESKVVDEYSDSHTDSYSCNYINNTKASDKIHELWTNPNPTSIFNEQDITLNDSLENYKYYEVQYKGWRGNPQIGATGKLPIEFGTFLLYFEGQGTMAMRTLNKTSNTIFHVNKTGGTGIDNNYAIPYKILGYK